MEGVPPDQRRGGGVEGGTMEKFKFIGQKLNQQKERTIAKTTKNVTDSFSVLCYINIYIKLCLRIRRVLRLKQNHPHTPKTI